MIWRWHAGPLGSELQVQVGVLLLQLATVSAWMSELRKHPGMEAGEVPLSQGPTGPAPTLMASSPSPTILCLEKLYCTGLSCLQPCTGLSPIPPTVSEQAPSGRTGALDSKCESCVHTLSSARLCDPRKSLCALSRLCFCLSNPLPGPQARFSSLPAWATSTISFLSALSASVLQFSAIPTGPPPSCLCSHSHPLSSGPSPV